MKRSRTLGRAFVCLVCLAALVRAEEPAPIVTLVLSGQDALLPKIKAIMVDMARSPNQYATLKDLVDGFLRDTDPKSPLSCRVYLIGRELREVYTAQVPSAADLKRFRNNLDSIGFPSRVDPRAGKGEDLFRISGSDTGSIRFDARTKSVQVVPIGNTKDPALRKASMDLARSVTGPAPSSVLGGRDIVLLLQNGADRLSDRTAAFSRRTESAKASIEEKLAGETDVARDLRVAAARQQLDELQRLFVEAQRLMVGSRTSIINGQHTLDAELIPLPDTSLARSAALLGQLPDEFAAIASEGALIVANVNLPVDGMRQKHLTELSKMWPAAIQERIDARLELSPEARQAEQDLGELVTQVITEVAELGVFNGFVRVSRNGREYTTLGGVRVPEGRKILATLARMAERKNSRVKLEIEKVSAQAAARATSPVAIHSITVPHATKEFPEFFANDGVIYVGTGEKTVWSAYGEGSLDVLRKAIEDTASSGPKPSENYIDAKLVLHPYLDAWDRWQGSQKEPSLRRAAIEGLSAGGDLLTVRLWRDARNTNLIRLEAIAESGLLRAAGKMAAKVIRDNVER